MMPEGDKIIIHWLMNMIKNFIIVQSVLLLFPWLFDKTLHERVANQSKHIGNTLEIRVNT